MSDQPGSKRAIPELEPCIKQEKDDEFTDIDAGQYTKFTGMCFTNN